MYDRFSRAIQKSVVHFLDDLIQSNPESSEIYGFALIIGQRANYLGTAYITRPALRRHALRYFDRGYRYVIAYGWTKDMHIEEIENYLRWRNPDDGWTYGDFSPSLMISEGLVDFKAGLPPETDAQKELERLCTETLRNLVRSKAWVSRGYPSDLILGVTEGEDPRDYVKTATYINEFDKVDRLWSEFRLQDNMSYPPESVRILTEKEAAENEIGSHDPTIWNRFLRWIRSYFA